MTPFSQKTQPAITPNSYLILAQPCQAPLPLRQTPLLPRQLQNPFHHRSTKPQPHRNRIMMHHYTAVAPTQVASIMKPAAVGMISKTKHTPLVSTTAKTAITEPVSITTTIVIAFAKTSSTMPMTKDGTTIIKYIHLTNIIRNTKQ